MFKSDPASAIYASISLSYAFDINTASKFSSSLWPTFLPYSTMVESNFDLIRRSLISSMSPDQNELPIFSFGGLKIRLWVFQIENKNLT